ncbi:MAG TPA: hypothetical protein VF531_14345 [Bacillota bacterium]
MRKLSVLVVAVLLLMLAAWPAYADETLLSGDVDNGGFGGPGMKFTQVNGTAGTLVGGSGGWLIDHQLLIGGGGYGLAGKIKAPASAQPSDTTLYINMGYGGLVMEYTPNSGKLYHLDYSLLIGGGYVSYAKSNYDPNFDQPGTTFFVAEPGVRLTLNVSDYFRAGVGASYRYVNGVELTGLDSAALSGVSANLFFTFGQF